MYEGTYYKHVLRLNELKKQLAELNEEIKQLEQLLIDTEPTDCRGDTCG
jgi:hypothetical protein